MLEVNVVFKVTSGFAAIIVIEVKGKRPACKLGVLVLGDVGEAFVALEDDLAGFLVETGESVSVSTLLLVLAVRWVCVSKHGDFVAKAIEVISGPGKRGIWNGTGASLGIGRVPPAAIDGVYEGG